MLCHPDVDRSGARVQFHVQENQIIEAVTASLASFHIPVTVTSSAVVSNEWIHGTVPFFTVDVQDGQSYIAHVVANTLILRDCQTNQVAGYYLLSSASLHKKRFKRDLSAKAAVAIVRLLSVPAENRLEQHDVSQHPQIPVTKIGSWPVLMRLLKRFVLMEQWYIEARPNPRIASVVDASWDYSSASVREYRPPVGRIWADPFPVTHKGSLWLFFEEQYVGHPGTLVCAPIDESGKMGDVVPVMHRSYHLSYPHVFTHEGELFMIPETHQARSVDLYRCTRFPDQWEFVAHLLSGNALVDATVVKRPEGWFLFAAGSFTGTGSLNEELYLFHSPELTSEDWQPHPHNPVVADPRWARGAGRIFEEDGRLYRPAQDCLMGYGKSVVLREITVLTADAFQERTVARIEPDRARKQTALHTWNRSEEWLFTDAKQWRLYPRVRKRRAS